MPKPRALPVDEALWEQAKMEARRRYRVWPSPPASAFAAGWYKDQGGRWSGQQPLRQRMALSRNMRRNASRLSLGARVSFRGGTGGTVSSATAFKSSGGSKMPMFKFAGDKAERVRKTLKREAAAGVLVGTGVFAAREGALRVQRKAGQGAIGHLAAEVKANSRRAADHTSLFVRTMAPAGTHFAHGGNEPFYHPKTNTVVTAPGFSAPSILAHEVGHAHQYARGGQTLKRMHIAAEHGLRNAPFVGALQYARLHGSDPDRAQRWARGSAAVGAVGAAFHIGIEADASRRALASLRAAKAAGSGLSAAGYRSGRASLGYALAAHSVYALAPLAALGATVGVVKAKAYVSGRYKDQGGRRSGQQVSSATSLKSSGPKVPMFKFAKSRRPKEDGPIKRQMRSLGVPIATGLVVREAMASANNKFWNKHLGLMKTEVGLSTDSVRNAASIHALDSRPPLTSVFHDPKGRPMFLPSTNEVQVGENFDSPAVIAHEVGHAQQFARVGRPLFYGIGIARQAMKAPYVGAVQYARHHDTDPEKAKRWARGTAIVGGLTLAAHVALEADATRRGMAILRAGQAAGTGLTSPAYLAGRRGCLNAFGSHVTADLMPLAALGGTIAGFKIRDRFRKEMSKKAGGPGSGVRFHNTELITGYEPSPAVNLHNREKVMVANPPSRKGVWIKLSRVKFVGQRKYVIAKLGRMLAAADGDATPDWAKKPVQLYFDGTDYHVMDGHHRFLAAVRLHRDRIKANVWTEIPEGLQKEALTAQKARAIAAVHGLVPEPGTAWKWALRGLRSGKTMQQLGAASPKLIGAVRRIAKQHGNEAGALWGHGVKGDRSQVGSGTPVSYDLGNLRKHLTVIPGMGPDASHEAVEKEIHSLQGRFNTIHSHPKKVDTGFGTMSTRKMEGFSYKSIRSHERRVKSIERQSELMAEYGSGPMSDEHKKINLSEAALFADAMSRRRRAGAHYNSMPSGYATQVPGNQNGSDVARFLMGDVGTHHNIASGKHGLGIHTVRPKNGVKGLRTTLWTKPSGLGKTASVNIPMRAIRHMPADVARHILPGKASQALTGRALARLGHATHHLATNAHLTIDPGAMQTAHRYAGHARSAVKKVQTRLEAITSLRKERVQKSKHVLEQVKRAPTAPSTPQEFEVHREASQRLGAKGKQLTNHAARPVALHQTPAPKEYGFDKKPERRVVMGRWVGGPEGPPAAVHQMPKALNKAASLEAAAAAEHRQWETWARSLMVTLDQKGAKGLAKRVRGWKPLFVPYSKLSDEDKEKDREWARKALSVRK